MKSSVFTLLLVLIFSASAFTHGGEERHGGDDGDRYEKRHGGDDGDRYEKRHGRGDDDNHMMGPGYGYDGKGKDHMDKERHYGYRNKGYLKNPDVKKYLDNTKEIRRNLHIKKFDYFEAMRDENTEKKMLTKLRKEIVDLQFQICEKAPWGC